MKKFINIVLLIFVIIIAIFRYTFRNNNQVVKNSTILLDTVIDIKVTGKNIKKSDLTEKTFELIKKYEDKFDYHNPTSQLSEINNSSKAPIDNDFYQILKYSQEVYELSDSLYDVSIGQLTDIWDFSKTTIPSDTKIDSIKQKIGFDKITFSQESISKPLSIKINLGSIAKGYILDKALDFLKSQKNVKKAIISAGGDIKCFGYDKDILIGVQHPRKRTSIIAKLKIKNKAVVTSGDYERFFIKNGKRYHHILNPKTGYPTENIYSVTIISDSAIEGDALSTACFTMEPPKAITMINNIKNVEAMIYYKESNDEIISIKTKGMKGYLVNEN